MYAALVLALVTASLAEDPPKLAPVDVRVVLVDATGKDVTKEALPTDRRVEVELATWGSEISMQGGPTVEFGRPVRVTPPATAKDAWSVGLAAPLRDRADAMGTPGDLAPGWVIAGDPCPWIDVDLAKSGEHALAIRVARAVTVEFTYLLPDGYLAAEDLRVSVGVVLPGCAPRGLEFRDELDATKIVTHRKIELAPGRHSAWAASHYRETVGHEFWAHETFDVSDAKDQRVVLRLRRGVEVTGMLDLREKDGPGRPLLMLTAPELYPTFGRNGSTGWTVLTLWRSERRADGSSLVRGLPPGIEMQYGLSSAGEKLTVRTPEKNGDLGLLPYR